MDNITHTLVGAALAEAGLKRRTALGAATLMIGANFPDIDVIAVPLGDSITWRRGITHGFLALVILPFVLAWLMRLYDRRVRLRRHPDATPADYRQLVVLSAIAILTHPTLDFMNTYGMRWLMPFVNKWFYADGLFVVDLWVMIALVLGVVWSRGSGSARPAGIALGGLTVYVVGMLTITGLGRKAVAERYPGSRIMVSPTVLTPWAREILVEERLGYRFGRYSLFSGVQMGPSTMAKGDSDPSAALAMQQPAARSFLKWARFPFYRVVREGGRTTVRIADARYSGERGGGWASVEVALP
jgi:inner membrane protein